MSNTQKDIVVNGMILSATPVGESDKRLALLTKERGKIVVFARGAKRQNSPLLSVSNPFACGTFKLLGGRTAYYLQSAHCDYYFRELTKDYEKSCYGFYFLEFAGYFAMENNDETALLNLLTLSIRALLNPSIPDKLVRYIFELKVLTINGEAPYFYHCCACKKEVTEGYFSLDKRGILCSHCSVSDEYYIGQSALYTMQYIIGADLKKLYSFVVTEEVYEQLKRALDAYRSRYVEHTFQSEAFLEA